MSLATIITGFALWIPLRVLDRYILNTTKTINLLILTVLTTTIGLSVYLVLSKIFKIKELNSFISLIKRIGNYKKILSQTEKTLESAIPPQP